MDTLGHFEHPGYWRLLLGLSAFLLIVSSAMWWCYFHVLAQRSDGSNYRFDLFADVGALFGGVGLFVAIPAMIGWGVHSSGVRQTIAAASEPRPRP